MENITKIFIINLDERKDRWFYCEQQARLFGFKNYERFSAIKKKNGVTGCTLSHKTIVDIIANDTKKSDTDVYMIMEDDFFFSYSVDMVHYFMTKLFSEKNFDSWDVFCLSRIVNLFLI